MKSKKILLTAANLKSEYSSKKIIKARESLDDYGKYAVPNLINY
jgi:hypothetical protein